MLNIAKDGSAPEAYLDIAKLPGTIKPIIRNKCSVHGQSTFVLAKSMGYVCVDEHAMLPGLRVVEYTCVKCLSELSERSPARLIIDAHTRELKRIFGNMCIACGYSGHTEILEFHHVIPENKNNNIADKKSFDSKFSEAQKCVLLCPTCHSLADRDLLEENIVSLFSRQYTVVSNNLGGNELLGTMKQVLDTLQGKVTEEDKNAGTTEKTI